MNSLWVKLFSNISLALATTASIASTSSPNATVATKVSYSEAPECEGRPEFITEVRPQIIGGFEKLPSMVLVARDAEYYIESKVGGENVKIHSYQSFEAASASDTKVVCGSSAKSTKNLRFSLLAPTLIDATPSKKVGQSLWQFQMLAAPKGFSAWNQRSLALTQQESLEKTLGDFGGSYQIYQLSPEKYELVVSKSTSSVLQYLSIKFDAVKSL